GIPRGAPFVEPGRTGILLDCFATEWLGEAVRACQRLDRRAVAAVAARQFDTQRIVDTILAALADVRT
ncbi:MAG: hypothetical protein ABSG68_22880, partial [Thermoguttaceae bacterium]